MHALTFSTEVTAYIVGFNNAGNGSAAPSNWANPPCSKNAASPRCVSATQRACGDTLDASRGMADAAGNAFPVQRAIASRVVCSADMAIASWSLCSWVAVGVGWVCIG